MKTETLKKYVKSQAELNPDSKPFHVEYIGENQVNVPEKIEDLEQIFEDGISVKIWAPGTRGTPSLGLTWEKKSKKPAWEVEVIHQNRDIKTKQQMRNDREFFIQSHYESLFKKWAAQKRLEEIMQRETFLHELIHIYDEDAGDKVMKHQGSIDERALEVMLNNPELEKQIWQRLAADPNCKIEMTGSDTPLLKYLSKILTKEQLARITRLT